mgnify:CR=1 FL=1
MSFESPSLNVACRRARTWISRSMDDDLDETSRLRLNDHIASCAECERHQAVLQQGRTLLRGAEAEPSDNFEWKVQLGIQRALRERAAVELEPRSTGFWRPAMSSAAAVALLVVGAGWFFLPGQESTSVGGATFADPMPRVASTPVEQPDLSGAIPGTPIEIDATGSDFGIRTVGSFDERFRGDLYDPIRRDASTPDVEAVSELFRKMARGTMPGLRPVADGRRWPAHARTMGGTRGVQVLNLQIHGSKMPSAVVDDTMAVPETPDPR